ncbi:MAG: hypothetical protein MUO78_00980 [candidate division Zixibacteria bacterium]|nr:hypothetical protein [candidate division Zixibacteria bacterium]
MTILNLEEFKRGYEKFEEHEKRDAMYKVAKFLVFNFWGKPPEMADGLGVLLLTWNQAFYRYGIFDFDKLEKCVTDNLRKIETFRTRDITSLSNSDEDDIKELFDEFLKALQIDSGKKQETTSPVAVAKALHLLAPKFFPLWDYKIAKAYKCYYNEKPAEKYIIFCKKTKTVADQLRNYVHRSEKTIVKLIDEYNYSKYTKGWI